MRIDFQTHPYFYVLSEPDRRIVAEALKYFMEQYVLSARTENKQPEEKHLHQIERLLNSFSS